MKPSIAFFDTKPYDKEFFQNANADYGFDIMFYKNHLTAETVSLTKGYDAVCIFVNDQVTRGIARQLADHGIRLVALRCAGYNNIDLTAVHQKISVVRVPAYSPFAVAEHAVALIMSLNRKTHRAYYRVRDNNFAIHGFIGFDMHGKTAGIIGTGQIGRVVIDILKGFGMNVIAHDRFPDPVYAQTRGVDYVDLETLCASSDIISLHCPLTPETVHMINSESIALMKDGVMIINTGRGKLIHTKDLINGLKSGKIGSAGLDVYEEETAYFFEDYSSATITDDVLARLLTFPNVLITSHQGFFTREALDNIATTTLENIRLYFNDHALPNEICHQCDSTV